MAGGEVVFHRSFRQRVTLEQIAVHWRRFLADFRREAKELRRYGGG
jgi:hypothetical protein